MEDVNIQLKETNMKLFINAIKQVETSLVYDVNCERFEIYPSAVEGVMHVYFEFNYQIDDRIKRDDDKQIEKQINEILGESYGVSIMREDAFPNGYAAYVIKIRG